MPPARRSSCVRAAAAGLAAAAALAPAARAQHDCATATVVAALPFTDSRDTTAAPSSTNPGGCNSPAAIAAGALTNALWYQFTPAETTAVRLSITAQGYDVVSTLWTGLSCDALTEVACRDQPEPNVMHLTLTGGSTYWLSVGDFGTLPGGGPTTVQIDVDPDPLVNDACIDAIAVTDLPFETPFDTSSASPSWPPGTCNSVAAQQAGLLDNSIWYTFTPAMTADVTITVEPDAIWDPLLLLLRGPSCTSLTQVACRDANEPGEPESIRWTAMESVRYWIVVGDRGTLDGGGPGRLRIANPLGACCLPSDACARMTGLDCTAAGGLYQGDDSLCASPGYEAALGSAGACTPFENIAATGIPLTLGEDDGVLIPIGFPFPFFGEPVTEIGVSANGYLSLDGELGDFLNDPIPSPAPPNGLIAPLWTDLSPHLGGGVHHELRGTAGADLRLIVQWTNVPRFQQQDANTFQAVLFENGNIELRYGAITPAPFPAAITIGVEAADGLTGVSVPAASIGAGHTCILLAASTIGVDCVQMCPCELDGVDGVDVFDLLAYLDDWFLGAPRADMDGVPGVDVFDLLVMLECWFPASTGAACG